MIDLRDLNDARIHENPVLKYSCRSKQSRCSNYLKGLEQWRFTN
jgi:hypothetical protein